MKKTIGALMVAVSAVAFSANANATEYNPYVGLDYSYIDGVAKEYRPHYNAGKVNVGVDYNKYFGTEIFYQLSDSDKNNSRSYGDKFKSSFQAYGLDVYGYLPLGCEQTFALLGTAGIADYRFTYKGNDVRDGHDNRKARDHGVGYRLGLGAQYSIDNNLSIRAVARYVGLDKVKDYDHMMEYSVGAKYSF